MTDVWANLETFSSAAIANYLKNEYPQTVALVLTKISAEKRGEVLALLPENFAVEVVMRISRMEPVRPDIVAKIERSLIRDIEGSNETIDNIGILAEALENMNLSAKQRFMTAIMERNRELALKVNPSYVSIESTKHLSKERIQTLISKCDKKMLFIALLGASAEVRDVFEEFLPELSLVKTLEVDDISSCQDYIAGKIDD